jgi:hypothetical protein
MAVNGSEEARQLSQLDLMGYLFRRAGFGATRDELEAALAKGYEAALEELLHPEQVPDLEAEKRFWGAVSVRVDGTSWLYVAEHSRYRIHIYERVYAA